MTQISATGNRSTLETEAKLKALLFGNPDSNPSSGTASPGFSSGSPLSMCIYCVFKFIENVHHQIQKVKKFLTSNLHLCNMQKAVLVRHQILFYACSVRLHCIMPKNSDIRKIVDIVHKFTSLIMTQIYQHHTFF